MSRPSDELLLRFLQGDVSDKEREHVLGALEASPDLAAELRAAARGVASVESWAREAGAADSPPVRVGRGAPWWSLPLVAAATLVFAVPTTLALTASGKGPGGEGAGPDGAQVSGMPTTGVPSNPAVFAGAPDSAEPSYVVVLHGRWPDAAYVGLDERTRRAREYWDWTSALAGRGVLVAAGDLQWEPGLRLPSEALILDMPPEVVADPDFVVGMFAVRATSYEEAAAIAAECPHLDYGGSVSVRRVGAGFVTVPGMDDWSGD